MSRQTNFATPWADHESGARKCLSDGTLFAGDICPTCALRVRFMRLLNTSAAE